MGLNLYAKIEQYLDFEDEVSRLHGAFLSIVLEKKLDNILDVGCGQGSFLNQLSTLNLNSFGIDLSSEQIKICKQNGIKNVDSIPLNQVKEKYDCTTAIFDVINYIPKKEIKTFFDDMNLVLNQGGYFIFDVNSLFGFEDVAQGTLSIDLEDKFIVIDAIFEEEKLITDITLFSQDKNKLFKKENDCIIQHYYETSELKKLLKESGFEVEKVIDFNLHDSDENDKEIYICKKS
ncbi:methyltransferase domain-containing protein [Arcobacter sp.]|uniref:methyltransferase domain-containing protein n=1 Tax=Arcobacter sp. TaxID=1872629 RepID=UPI003D0B2B08